MNRQQAKIWLEEALKEMTVSWASEAKHLLCHILKTDLLGLLLSNGEEVSPAEERALLEAANQRTRGVPLQHIIGSQGFMGLDFKVNAHVLIPRPETECLVEKVIEAIRDRRALKVLDMGTGSGAIAISLAYALEQIALTAVDISADALRLAEENALTHGVGSRIRFVASDYFKSVPLEAYDLIVSNPPYIPLSDEAHLLEEVKGHEPHLALFAGDDGLDAYRVLIPSAWDSLKSGGQLFFEAGHNQSEPILEMMRAQGYVSLGTFCDLNGIRRFVYGEKG